MSLSTIILHENSLTNLSATAEMIRFCQDDKTIDQYHNIMYIYPGKQLNASLAAYGQTNVPVEKKAKILCGQLSNRCTTYKLYTDY